jgi:aspartate carbamoyltransferase catalytic subunit
VHWLTKLGAEVLLVGPPTLLPANFAATGMRTPYSLEEVLDRVDVINMLRVQFERLTSPAFPSTARVHQAVRPDHERLKPA